MATTPPPAADLPQTPPAPRLGTYYDSWEPYSPRKSARISERNINRTPSPRASPQPSSPRKHRGNQDAAPMSPRKRRQPVADSVRRASGSLTVEGSTKAATALGLNPKPQSTSSSAAKAAASASSSMLLTPTKTPRKPAASAQADVDGFKRNLFGSEEESSLSSRTKRPKKYSGLTMDSFTAETVEEPIAIFTDSQDRVPEKDQSASNPFYGGASSAAEPAKRRSKTKMVRIPGVGMRTHQEAARRDDGMLCSFRGKTFFRPFTDEVHDDDEESDSASASANRPLSRSSIKPRRLFQSEKPTPSIEDEEATTDVEDMQDGDLDDSPATPSKGHAKRETTPDAPKFGPVSPPATKRTTRSMNKLAEDSTPIKASRQSPFESWRVAKKNVKAPRSVKRQGDDLAQEQTKRARV